MSKIQQRRDQLKSLWSATQWNDIATYIGPNAETFKPAWEKQRDAILTKGYGITWSFSVPVFFLSFVWFFYRKQYLMGATLIAVPIILGAFFPVESGAYGGIAIFIALTAKSFYLQAAIPKIAKISAAAEDEAARNIALKNAGGVSKPAGIISLIVFILAAAAAIASAILLPASPS